MLYWVTEKWFYWGTTTATACPCLSRSVCLCRYMTLAVECCACSCIFRRATPSDISVSSSITFWDKRLFPAVTFEFLQLHVVRLEWSATRAHLVVIALSVQRRELLKVTPTVRSVPKAEAWRLRRIERFSACDAAGTTNLPPPQSYGLWSDGAAAFQVVCLFKQRNARQF
jgi:hypothetical protein